MIRVGAAALAAALLLLPGAAARGQAPAAAPATTLPADTTPPADTLAGLPVLDVPYLRQSEALCGGAAVAMVFRYWGDDSLDAGAFAPLVDDSARGIRTGALERAVRDLGWRGLAYHGSLPGIREQLRRGRPLIALLRVGPGRWHYVVVVAVGAKRVLVHDPARSPFLPLSIDAFRRMWEPSGRWTLLVLPPPSAPPGEGVSGDSATAAESGAGGGAAGTLPARPGAAGAPAAGEGPCAGRVAAAVRMAGADSLEAAARELEGATRTCPDAPAAHRELAGVRFRQRRWSRAAAEARRAHALDPGDAYTTRLLAASLYLEGRRDEALRTWNEIGEPRVRRVDAYGLHHVRYEVVARRADLPPDSLLTPRRLALVRRRVAAVPALARTRVGWRPDGRGGADLRVAAFERPIFPAGPLGLAVALAAGLPERSIRLPVGSLAGAGETWTASWRWWEERPAVRLELRVPDAAGLTGIWSVEGAWSRSAYRAGGPVGADTLRVRRWHGGLTVRRWALPWLRWRAGASLDRWAGRGGASPGGVLGVEVLAAGDRVRLAGRTRGWTGPGEAFGTARLALGLRTSTVPHGVVGSARAGVAAASGAAPLDTWPGAGTGHASPMLLRAHPLLDGGVVTGVAFGRRLAWAGASVTAWAPGLDPVAAGGALFVDAARAGAAPGGGARPGQVDVGAGLRLALPGGRSRLRLDFAHGLRDGENAISVGWEGAWPGSGDR